MIYLALVQDTKKNEEEIFCFPTEKDRAEFLKEVKKHEHFEFFTAEDHDFDMEKGGENETN